MRVKAIVSIVTFLEKVSFLVFGIETVLYHVERYALIPHTKHSLENPTTNSKIHPLHITDNRDFGRSA